MDTNEFDLIHKEPDLISDLARLIVNAATLAVVIAVLWFAWPLISSVVSPTLIISVMIGLGLFRLLFG